MRRSLPSISGVASGRKVKRCSRETTAGRIWLGSVVQKMKRTPRRWFLEGLEEDVPALLDALDLVDDEDLVAQVGGARVDARQELAHVVDLVVRRGVELDDVEGTALADGDAAGAGVAGLAVAQVGAVDGLGHDARHRGLARAARSDEEEAMADADPVAPRCAASGRRAPGRPSGRRSGRGSADRAPAGGPGRSGSSRSGCPSWRSVAAPPPAQAVRSAQPRPWAPGADLAVHPPSITTAREPDRSGQLGPGRSAAPGEQRLTLLPSGPDVVHASPLRGTRSSTPIASLASAGSGPREGIQPCWSGLQVQGTASSPPSTAPR